MRSSDTARRIQIVTLFGLLLSLGSLLTLGPPADDDLNSAVERDIRSLTAANGKVQCFGFINPGGPCYVYSEPMNRLVARGTAIQPRLLAELDNPSARNEVALILAKVADKDALPRLIELLPTMAKQTPAEEFTTTCLLYALWQTTGVDLGINSKWPEEYTPEVPRQWRAWYESNKDYLYRPAKPHRTNYGWTGDRVMIDLEAKLAGEPTESYRKEYPRIEYDAIKTWRDDPNYERKLKEFCFTTIIDFTWRRHDYVSREAIRTLSPVRDLRALATLYALRDTATDSTRSLDLIENLEERGNPVAAPVLEQLQQLVDEDSLRRSRAVERIRQREKYREELKGRPGFLRYNYTYLRCLEGSKGVDELVAAIRKRDNNCFLADYLHIAGFVDREPVRACLKELIADDTRPQRYRTRAHAALARLGENDSLEHLKKSLAHKFPCVRLAAAEGLWQLGSREGFRTLVELVDLRPVVTDGREANIDHIRGACAILGRMGDRSAVEPMKRLVGHLAESNTGGGGAGWCGRVAVIALAKLGEFAGIEHFRTAIRNDDRQGVVGSWDGHGCFVEIGLKRFAPELLPMLNHRDEAKRVLAAQDILILLECGK